MRLTVALEDRCKRVAQIPAAELAFLRTEITNPELLAGKACSRPVLIAFFELAQLSDRPIPTHGHIPVPCSSQSW